MIIPIVIICAIIRKPKFLIIDLTLYEKMIDIDLQLEEIDSNICLEWDIISYIEDRKLNKLSSDKYVNKFLICFGTKKEFHTLRKGRFQ